MVVGGFEYDPCIKKLRTVHISTFSNFIYYFFSTVSCGGATSKNIDDAFS